MTANRLSNSSLSENQLDGLLSAYFKSKMPTPWPECPRVEAESAGAKVAPSLYASSWRSPIQLSRLALAASLAVIIGGSFLLGNRLTPHTPSSSSDILMPRPGDSAERLKLPESQFRQTDKLLQKQDGTYYQIEFIEVSPEKKK